MDIANFLTELGIKSENSGVSTGREWMSGKGGLLSSYSPTDGKLIATCTAASTDEYEAAIAKAEEAFKVWRNVPAPKRGEIVRQMGDAFRKHKAALGALVSYEMGKTYQAGFG